MASLTVLRHGSLKTLIILLSLIVFVESYASGGDDGDRGLSGHHSPDFPLNGYVSGHLGVISPTYRLSYLIIAYRYLSHHPLSAQEQRHVLDSFAPYFSDLFFEDGFRVDLKQANAEIARQTYQTYPYYIEQSLSRWWKKSKKHPFSERVNRLIQGYPDPAKPFTKFQLACLRLKAIAHELEEAHLPEEKKQAILHTWLDAQDLVFNGESDGNTVREAIKKIPVDNLPLMQLDTRYLNAVSYFNSENEAEQLQAYELFTQLANNKQYPWHEWAAYLSYRALTRAACQEFSSTMPKSEQTQRLNNALTGMQTLTDKARDLAVKTAAKRYIRIIRGRLDPKGSLIERIGEINQKITRSNFSDVIFYTDLIALNWMPAQDLQALGLAEKASQNSDILFWVSHYLSTDKQKTFPIAYTHWVKSPDNQAWLLVALNTISEGSPSQQDTLLKAAKAVTAEQPGFFSIRSALIQALAVLKGNRRSAIRLRHALIDDTLAQLKAGEDFSTHIHFARMGIPLADSIDNLLSYGFFIPSPQLLSLYPDETPTPHPYFSPLEFSQALNNLPLSMLTQITGSRHLPQGARQELAASVWARAMLLQQYQVADSIALKAAQLNPAMKKYPLVGLTVKHPKERLKILVSALLYFPELSPIIHLKNTWTPEARYNTVYYGIKPRKIINRNSQTYWCDHGEINRIIYYDDRPSSLFSKGPWPNLLTALQQKQWHTEQEILQKLPNAAVWLADKATELAKQYPHDQENAELLALAINVTRVLACYKPNDPASQHAYATLKRLYPESEGAKRTPYYY